MSKKGNYKDLVEDKRIRDLLVIFGFDPREEYSMEALQQLEELIDVRYPQGHRPLPTTLIPFGWYFLHTLLDKLPDAKVNYDVDSIWAIEVTYKPTWNDGEMTIWPFRRVDKFWKDRSDRMSSMLEMTMLFAENNPESFEDMADDEGWVKLPSGTMFRTKSIKTDKDVDVNDVDTSEAAVRLNANKLIKGL